MAKLALVLFVTLTISLGFLPAAKSEGEERAASAEKEGEDRSGAYANAKAAAAARLRPGAGRFPPSPGPLGSNECISCIDCPDPKQGIPKQCPVSPDPSKNNLCVTYSEKYHNQKEAVIRGCVSERGTCSEIRKVLTNIDVKLLSCHECKGDKCNGASRSVTDLTMAIVALLITPLLAKVTLS